MVLISLVLMLGLITMAPALAQQGGGEIPSEGYRPG